MSFTIEVVTSCEKCGAPLGSDMTTERYGEKLLVNVEPCLACIRQAEEDAEQRGQEKGYEQCEQEYEGRGAHS